MDESLHIRSAHEGDFAFLYKIICDLEEVTLSSGAFRSILIDNLAQDMIRYFVAEWGGEPVGMISCHVQNLLHHAAKIGEIQEMYVIPEFRSRGVGSCLVQAAVRFARESGAEQLEVTTNLQRILARRFYEREGFQPTHSKLVRSVSRPSGEGLGESDVV